MRKVVCPHCGLVNLDRFVTYPHCAGCGTRLPESQPSSALAFWKRPMRAPFWASIVALVCAAMAVVAVGIVRETARLDYGQLVVYAQVPRTGSLHSLTFTQFHLDSTDPRAPAIFRSVRLRLPRQVLEGFDVVAVTPEPTETFHTGGGSYYQFDEIPKEEPIRLTLRSMKPGEYRFNAQIYAQDYQPFECHNYVTVLPAPAKLPPSAKPQGNNHAHQ